ncbi:site-specific DNA-methyltransferase [Weissella confusa]|uniref:site-specific DNA-methyltransferase n=1 Tax=Weissella confusa TaxID=1583 RepID=UPI00223C0C5F|nr:site-specific DNA-methyltransferase [Weissella confusa]MCT0042173.1 site-specific DNA-methyltransferase [Weissella confusa]
MIESKLMEAMRSVLSSNETFKQKYWRGETLKRNKVIEDLRAYDENLIQALLANELIAGSYTFEVGGKTVVKLEQLSDALQYKAYWEDSYTKFANKIGLTADGKFIDESSDVVLQFPFADTVLKAAMTKSDKAKEDLRPDEPFLNEIIAKTEIDTLFSPKVLKNVQFVGDSVASGNKANLVIKGNNLIVLHGLVSQFAGKVKSIFIDPPYNTENDGFDYNDRFNQSTWLTFMKNRLEVARDLLSDNGSIALTIDYNEIGYLLVLLDSVFGRENLQNVITVKRASASGAKVINPGVVTVSDYLVIYSKDKTQWKPNKVFAAKERDNRYNQFLKNREDSYENWEFMSLLDAFAAEKGLKKSELKKTLGEGYDRQLDEFAYSHAKQVFRFVALDDGQVSQAARDLKKKSKENPDTIFYMERPGYNDYYMKNGQAMLFMSERLIEVDGKPAFGTALTDIWDDVLPNDLHNEGGVSFKKGKKPEKLIRRILELTSDEGDLVMDFFGGSGTTAAVAMKTERRFITIEQMEYIDDVLMERLKKTQSGERTAGVSNDTNWQGGGSFVYAELMEKNQGFIGDIDKADTPVKLETVYNRMKEVADFDFRADLDKFVEAKGELTFEERKQMLVKILDKNQLYYNYADIDDEDVRDLLSDEDYNFNKAFYEGGEA